MPSRNGVQRSTAGVIRYSMGKKIIIIFINLTGKNRGLSGLKNIWPVIMTGDLLSVILSLVGSSSRHFTVLSRDANPWRSKIWRLPFLHLPPPPQQIEPAPNGNDLGHHTSYMKYILSKFAIIILLLEIIFVSDY